MTSNKHKDARRRGRFRNIGIFSVFAIIAISYGLYILLQDIAEANIKDRLFEQKKQEQLDANKAIFQNVKSDVDSILTKLKVVATSSHLQQNISTWIKSEPLLQEMYEETKQLVGKTDGMFIVDKNGFIQVNALTQEEQEKQRTYVGNSIAYRQYVNETRLTREPIFSTGLFSLDGVYRMFITHPIVNAKTGEYLGLVSASIPTMDFFKRFGNVYDVYSQHLIALDKSANYLAHGDKELIGKNFYGRHIDEFSRPDRNLQSLVNEVLSGHPGYDISSSPEREEMLITGYPISLHGERPPSYSVFIITPTSQIYSDIENILYIQRIETFSLLAIVTAAAGIFMVFLINWNSILDKEVKRRTRELNESNKQLSDANLQLKVHDKMQSEFINVAAHELRTPIMPILGVTDLIKSRFFEDLNKKSNNDNNQATITKEELEVIIRNCMRLQQLAEDVLTTSRIESRSLQLHKEKFNLNKLVLDILSDMEVNISNNVSRMTSVGTQPILGSSNLKLLYESDGNNDTDNGDIVVYADKQMIGQVLLNLLDNATKFTKSGTISASVAKQMREDNHQNKFDSDHDSRTDDSSQEAVVKIRDTGIGIDPEILPRLFSKFATKSNYKGTGLGLFISKNIVEAHGGKIWGENNSETRGATFVFTLPICNQN
jgi:signal transduction histidine kinase